MCGRPRASLEEKLRLAFSLFDANGSGRIDGPELFQLLRLMTGRVHDDKDLQAITNGCAYMKNRTSAHSLYLWPLSRHHHDWSSLGAPIRCYTCLDLRRFPSGFTFEIFCQMVDISDLNRLTLSL